MRVASSFQASERRQVRHVLLGKLFFKGTTDPPLQIVDRPPPADFRCLRDRLLNVFRTNFQLKPALDGERSG